MADDCGRVRTSPAAPCFNSRCLPIRTSRRNRPGGGKTHVKAPMAAAHQAREFHQGCAAADPSSYRAPRRRSPPRKVHHATRCAHPTTHRGADHCDASAPRGAQRAGHAGTGLGRTDRDLLHRQARDCGACRRCLSLSRSDADAEYVGRLHGRRHLIGNRSCSRSRPARGRQRVVAARACESQ
jgi:hypothetical protein